MTPHSPAKISVGTPLNRVDGRLKVTGKATYSADAAVSGLTHAILVQSTIAAGRIRKIYSDRALKSTGVLAVITPFNAPKLSTPTTDFMKAGVPGENRVPLSDATIHYAGQHIAVVVAHTVDQARHAATLLDIEYEPSEATLDLHDPKAKTTKPKEFFGVPLQVKRGDVEAAKTSLADAATIHQVYSTPTETHNPMELSATVAQWDGERLTVWDATQYIMGSRAVLAETFGLPRENVRVICPFVGGGFGCKGFQWPHTVLAALSAKAMQRPVKLMLTREQMFTSCGHRPAIDQELTLTAGRDGKLVALEHAVHHDGAPTNEFTEACAPSTSGLLYAVPNVMLSHTVHILNTPPATPMRAPGENPGTFALESAMDELAAELKIDPIQLRLINYAETDPESGKPWSSKQLRDCYQLGAEKFGWGKRNPKPGSMKAADGSLIGWGMATATYPGFRFPASVRIRLIPDGDSVKALASCATHDLGTGAYTVFTQITADAVGLPADRVKFELGDSTLPYGPVAGGSNSTASVGQAIVDASIALKLKLIEALAKESMLRKIEPSDLILQDGRLVSKSDGSQSIALIDVLRQSGKPTIEGLSTMPGSAPPGDKALPIKPKEGTGEYYQAQAQIYKFQSFGCHFVEVSINPMIPRVSVTRVVSVIDNGRVINPKTSRSQLMGGVIMGIGMALLEDTVTDPKTGRYVNANLADYPVCVNPDISTLETYFIDKPDPYINAMGARGIGEIGITGVAAAVANAVYHATGQRFRDLPITPDKLLAHSGVFA